MVVHRPVAAASPESLLEMQSLKPQPSASESESAFNRPPGNSCAHWSWRRTALVGDDSTWLTRSDLPVLAHFEKSWTNKAYPPKVLNVENQSLILFVTVD